jgi:adenylate cyclase
MQEPIPGTSQILVGQVADWLMNMALRTTDLETIVEGCCERLSAAGLPLVRIHLSFSMLHPLYSAMGFTWRRGESLQVEGYRHASDDTREHFTASPYYHLLTHGLDHLRCRLEEGTNFEFPVFEDLKRIGVTDYMAFVTEFDSGSGQGMLGSWSTDRIGGFHEYEIAELLRIQKRLAVACKVAVQGALARNMLTTYLGSDAGSRVLNGQTRRGDGETTRAAIIVGDIRESSRMAEELGREGYIEVLNTFFDNVAGSYVDARGEILSFLGDGFLAVLPCSRNRSASNAACHTVLSATQDALEKMAAVNENRTADGKQQIDFGIGLHIGNVMYGNVGLLDRLTFSVFGSTVNEAARLESLTKKYRTPVVVSEAFAEYCGCEFKELGTECLRGVNQAMKVFTPVTRMIIKKPPALPKRAANVGRSDAENVVLLHRGGPRKTS